MSTRSNYTTYSKFILLNVSLLVELEHIIAAFAIILSFKTYTKFEAQP